ncbi:MAG: hypothetical protein QOC77_3874 [Thermoleophilaceae bacterium]|jgi:hypothetical protein|nr:hypothetical protein [Thermoleophilaceae bacterium]MEA2469644.1 hypothetical protein [Thermoleophilaceae bacterium]
MKDADLILSRARRPLVVGIGGGGDVVGALATAEAARLYHGARPLVGGVPWERRPIDPVPGPRGIAEIEDAEEVVPGTGVLLARPRTRVRGRDVLFAESHMAEFLGEPTLLVDVLRGPAAIAAGLASAAARLDVDLIVFADVGGDVLAHGHEPGLGSPLCDALMLAAAVRLERDGGIEVLGAIFGPGCDGELTLAEVSDRLASVARAGGLAGARGLTPPIADRLEAAIEHVPTEASAQAVRGFRGVAGPTSIRGGRRALELMPAVALTVYYDVTVAYEASAPLARAVAEAGSLDEANEVLRSLGVRSELDWELDAATGRA